MYQQNDVCSEECCSPCKLHSVSSAVPDLQEKDENDRVCVEMQENDVTLENKENNSITAENKENDSVTAENKENDSVTAENKENDSVSAESEENVSSVTPDMQEKDQNDCVSVEMQKNGNVTPRNNLNDNVTPDNKENDSVTPDNKENDSVTAENKENDSVTAKNKENGSVTAENKENDSVTAENKENDSMTAENKENGSVTAENKENDSVTAENKENDSVTAANKENDNVTAENKENDSMTAANKENDSVTAEDKENDSVTAEDKENDSVTAEDKENDSVSVENEKNSTTPEIFEQEKETVATEMSNKICQVGEMVQELQAKLERASVPLLQKMLQDKLTASQQELQKLTLQKKEYRIKQMKDELAELEECASMMSQAHLKDFLTAQINRIKQVEEQQELGPQQEKTSSPAPAVASALAITPNYEWFNSEKFMKLYIDIPGLSDDDRNKVKVTFTTRGFDLSVSAVAAKTYTLRINNLAGLISKKDSIYRVKKDRVVLFLHKRVKGHEWEAVTLVAARQGRRQQNSYKHYTIVAAEVDSILRTKLGSRYRSELLQLLKHDGFYHIHDAASAAAALKDFSFYRPRVLTLHISGQQQPQANGSGDSHQQSQSINGCTQQQGHSDHSSESVFEELLAFVAKTDCILFVTSWDTFTQNPETHETDAARLALILNKRCSVRRYYGYPSAALLPDILSVATELGVVIATKQDAKELASLKFPEHCPLTLLGVSVSRSIKFHSWLEPLPWTAGLIYHLHFSALTDDDVTWLLECCRVLVEHNLQHANPLSVLFGVERTVIYSSFWLCLSCNKFSMNSLLLIFGAMAVITCVGVMIEAPHLTEKDKKKLQQVYTKQNGCPIFWHVTPPV